MQSSGTINSMRVQRGSPFENSSNPLQLIVQRAAVYFMRFRKRKLYSAPQEVRLGNSRRRFADRDALAAGADNAKGKGRQVWNLPKFR